MNNIYEAPQANLSKKPLKINSQLTDRAIENLAKGIKWAKFLTIVGYFALVFFPLGASFFLIGATHLNFNWSSVGLLVVAILILVTWLIYKVTRFMHKYYQSVQLLVDSHDSEHFIQAQQYFKKWLKWYVISLIVGVVLGILFVSVLSSLLINF